MAKTTIANKPQPAAPHFEPTDVSVLLAARRRQAPIMDRVVIGDNVLVTTYDTHAEITVAIEEAHIENDAQADEMRRTIEVWTQKLIDYNLRKKK